MGFPQKHSVSITTATGGGATGYTPVVRGQIHSIKYALGPTGATFPSTADFTVTLEDSGVTLWSQSNVPIAAKTVHPMIQAQATTGGDATGEFVRPHAVGERVKIVVAGGGDTKQGTFQVVAG